MKTIGVIARREFAAYFTSPIAYVYLITFLAVAGWIFFRTFFLIGQADMRVFFGIMPWVFLFFVPAVAMGAWAEERRRGTLEILLTLPIRDRDVVLAKFAAGMGLIATALLLTLPIAVTVAAVGDLDWGPVVGGYLGLLFLGGAYLAIGLVASALTQNQIVAFIIGVAASFALLMAGTPLISGGSSAAAAFIAYLGLGRHFDSIARGVVDSRDVVYYLSVIAFFLFVNLRVLEARARRAPAFIAIATLLVLLGAANILVARHPARLDLTANRLYTLSASTQTLLDGLTDVVTIRAYFTREMPPALMDLRRDVEDLLAEFKSVAGSRLQVDFIDPGSSLVEEQQATMIGVQPVQLNVVENDKAEVAKVFLGIAVLYGGRQQVIPVVARIDSLEYEIAEAILKVSSNELPHIAWWEGEESALGDGFGLVREALARRYAMTRIEASTVRELAAGAFDALVLASPRALSDAELFAIDQYLMGGGRLIALIDRYAIGEELALAKVETPALDLVKHYGATVLDALVVDQQSATAAFAGGVVTYRVPYPYWPDVRRAGFARNEPIVADLESLVLPWTSPLALAGGDASSVDLALSSPMAAAVPGAVARLDPQSAGEALRNGPRSPQVLAGLVQGPFGSYAAAGRIAIPRGSEVRAESTPEAKIVVVGSSRWLTDRLLATFPQNANFFENAVDAMAMGDQLIGIRSREHTQRPIASLPDEGRLVLKAFNLGLGPLVVCIAGVVVVVVRRARRRRARSLYR